MNDCVQRRCIVGCRSNSLPTGDRGAVRDLVYLLTILWRNALSVWTIRRKRQQGEVGKKNVNWAGGTKLYGAFRVRHINPSVERNSRYALRRGIWLSSASPYTTQNSTFSSSSSIVSLPDTYIRDLSVTWLEHPNLFLCALLRPVSSCSGQDEANYAWTAAKAIVGIQWFVAFSAVHSKVKGSLSLTAWETQGAERPGHLIFVSRPMSVQH